MCACECRCSQISEKDIGSLRGGVTVIAAMRILGIESRSSARVVNAIIRNNVNATNPTHCISKSQFREADGIKHLTYTICSCKFSLPISNFRNKFL